MCVGAWVGAARRPWCPPPVATAAIIITEHVAHAHCGHARPCNSMTSMPSSVCCWPAEGGPGEHRDDVRLHAPHNTYKARTPPPS